MKKNNFKNSIMFLFMCVLVLCSCNQAYAADLDTSSIPASTEEIKNQLVTTMTITDSETGETESYEIADENIDIYNSESGETTVVVNVEPSDTMTRGSQTNSNTLYGWKGNVRISWYDNGSFARLISAGGDWSRVSGSYSMSNKLLTWGQDLMTNSNRSSASFVSSYNVTTSWASGKYAYGLSNCVGANIDGLVNGKWVNITCNYYF